MSDELTRRRSLESLRKEAKHWLHALRANDAAAQARFRRALPDAPGAPSLRDVQHALAREHGYAGWVALKEAIGLALERDTAARTQTLARYEEMASALLEAYRTGTPDAMERHYAFTWHRRPWRGMRRYVQLDLDKRPAHPDDDVDITLDDARHLVAREYGFATWFELTGHVRSLDTRRREAAKPVRLVPVPPARFVESPAPIVRSRDWDVVLDALRAHPSACLDAQGQMTDGMLAEVCRVPGITALDLSGSGQVTDEGLQSLARLPHLVRLDLSWTSISDRGLRVLRELPRLEVLSLAGTRISDEGTASLADCEQLREVSLAWTRTGDGALRALAGKDRLTHLATGNAVTDAGLPLLHEVPAFKTWRGGGSRIALLSSDVEPNNLTLRGSFTDRGCEQLRGLDGLFGLNLDDSALALTAAAMVPLVGLPRLGRLAVDAKDDWMPHIAAMPSLRFLLVQDSVAGDAGFAALSASQSIEMIWGRRCHNLGRRGFTALATMPKLRSLSVSCLNVDDAGISTLPSFPALRELMPIDVPDAGYRHIGACRQLESLVLMYCRETTDAATEHITSLDQLTSYFNSYTTVTDRTPELLSGMESLERITFDSCHQLTNRGVRQLARLPRLRELRVSGNRITEGVSAMFPDRVQVFVGD